MRKIIMKKRELRKRIKESEDRATELIAEIKRLELAALPEVVIPNGDSFRLTLGKAYVGVFCAEIMEVRECGAEFDRYRVAEIVLTELE